MNYKNETKMSVFVDYNQHNDQNVTKTNTHLCQKTKTTSKSDDPEKTPR